MAKLEQWDAAKRRLARVAVGGAVAKSPDPLNSPALEDLQRRCKALEEVVNLMLQHARQGPEWGSGAAREFRISYRNVDVTSRQLKITHGFGYAPDRFMVVLASSITTGGAVTTWGGIVMVSADENYATFEIDADAYNNEMSFLVIIWKEAMVPQGVGKGREIDSGGFQTPPGHVDMTNINA